MCEYDDYDDYDGYDHSSYNNDDYTDFEDYDGYVDYDDIEDYDYEEADRQYYGETHRPAHSSHRPMPQHNPSLEAKLAAALAALAVAERKLARNRISELEVQKLRDRVKIIQGGLSLEREPLDNSKSYMYTIIALIAIASIFAIIIAIAAS